MLVYLTSTENGLYLYSWICPKCDNIHVDGWNSLDESDNEIIYCCKFKYEIDFKNKKLLYESNSNKFKDIPEKIAKFMELVNKHNNNLFTYEKIYDLPIIRFSKEYKNINYIEEIAEDTNDEVFEENNGNFLNECCYWKLNTDDLSTQKKIMKYSKNGDIIRYKDNTLRIVYEPYKNKKEIINFMEEGLYLVPSRITSNIKNPIEFYHNFTNLNNKDYNYPFIQAIEFDPDTHTDIFSKIIGNKDYEILTSGVICFNECYEDFFVKPLYWDNSIYKVNIMDFL